MVLHTKEIKVSGYERVIEFSDNTDFLCYISLHNTKLGPGLGGTRLKSYSNNSDALLDVVRLSKAMSYKNSLAGLNYGGAKCVVNSKFKNRDTILKVGEAVEYFNGDYYTAEDVGTTLEDIGIMREVTNYTAQLDGSAMTARGVLAAMKAALQFRNRSRNIIPEILLHESAIWVQGLGKVGMDLFNRLTEYSTEIYVSDLNKNNLDYAMKHNAKQITDNNSDDIQIYSPCAMGQVINETNVNNINYSIICGSANNQLVRNEYAEILKSNDILYIPDYLANAGGVINAAHEINRVYNEEECNKATDIIGERVFIILEMAEKENTTPLFIANRLAEMILGLQ